MVLVNGAEGIGTGWSTSIHQFNPRDLVNNLRNMMRGQEINAMLPWYKGFQGTIEKQQKGFNVTGYCRLLGNNQLEITELPVGKWTRDYKTFLEELAQKDEIDDIAEYHTDNRVHFIITSSKLPTTFEELIKKFKLSSSLATTNFVLFSHEGKIKKYADEIEIIQEFFKIRS